VVGVAVGGRGGTVDVHVADGGIGMGAAEIAGARVVIGVAVRAAGGGASPGVAGKDGIRLGAAEIAGRGAKW
jgi:hypothetical protein